jgi:homoserine dehydrogenase
VRLLLAGFGHVGRRLVELLDRPQDHPGLVRLQATVVAVTTGSHGAWADPAGLAPARILEQYQDHGGFPMALDTLEAARGIDYDVLVELSPLTVGRRGEPAIAHVRAALARGRHVVSANKGPVAWACRELRALARARGARFLFESAVMDGTPVFNLVRHCLPGTTVLGLDGVLNSTTNVVLGRMEQGETLERAVALAQEMGIAEADPAADLEGWDAAVKLTALANVLMDADLVPEAVQRQGILHLVPGDLAAAARRGRRIKLVCEAFRAGAGVQARVGVQELEPGHPFARLEGADSILRLHTDLMGRLSILEESPGLTGTAYGVIADLLELARQAGGATVMEA